MNEIKKGYVPNEVYKVEQFGNTFKLIDTAGVKVGTLGATTPLASVALSGDFDSTADTTVGPDGTGGVEILSGTSFNGSADLNAFLDDFVLYSDVLTAEEADQLYNTGGSDPSLYQEYNNLIAHWTFNEGSGSTVTDEVSGFVGTLGTGATAPTFSTDNAG